LETARSLKENAGLLFYIGAAHAGRGGVDDAVAALSLSFDYGFENIDLIERSPHYTTISNDPRFIALLTAHKPE